MITCLILWMPTIDARVSASDHPSATAATATIATSGIRSATRRAGRRPPSFRRRLVRPWDGMWCACLLAMRGTRPRCRTVPSYSTPIVERPLTRRHCSIRRGAVGQPRLGCLPLDPEHRQGRAGQAGDRLVDEVARLPGGEELGVEAVQPLDLEPPVADAQDPREQPLGGVGRVA